MNSKKPSTTLLAETYYNLALTYKNKGEIGQAIKEYQKAIEIDPNFMEAHYNLGKIYQEKGEHIEAAREFGKHLELLKNKKIKK